jgi:hypothetical protein
VLFLEKYVNYFMGDECGPSLPDNDDEVEHIDT